LDFELELVLLVAAFSAEVSQLEVDCSFCNATSIAVYFCCRAVCWAASRVSQSEICLVRSATCELPELISGLIVMVAVLLARLDSEVASEPASEVWVPVGLAVYAAANASASNFSVPVELSWTPAVAKLLPL